MGKNFEPPHISQLDCASTIKAKLKTEDFKILNYQLIPFQEINGYLGEHCTLQITIERNSCEEIHTFFVKSLPQVESQRTFLEEINGAFKEKSFFTKYCPLLKKHGIHILDEAVPTCFYSTEESFIFEDLKARGYETFSPRVPLSLDCVKAGLSAFAKLHASGLLLEEMKMCRLTDHFEVELREGFYLGTEATEQGVKSGKTGARALIDITHEDEMKISKDTLTEKVLEGIDLQKFVTTPTNRFRNTICHADTWTKNFLFKFEGQAVNCMIVDFQTYRYGPPAQDVLCFINMVSDRQLRQKHLDDLLEFYYEELRINVEKHGFKDVITKQEFFDSCAYFKQFALTQTLMHFQVVVMSDEVASELFSDPKKAKFVLFEDKYDFFKMACQRDPVFKKRNFEVITDLREFYEGN